MDYTTDDMPAGLRIVEHPPGSFAWVLQREGANPPLQADGRDGYASWEEAMADARRALGLPVPPPPDDARGES